MRILRAACIQSERPPRGGGAFFETRCAVNETVYADRRARRTVSLRARVWFVWMVLMWAAWLRVGLVICFAVGWTLASLPRAKRRT